MNGGPGTDNNARQRSNDIQLNRGGRQKNTCGRDSLRAR